jgi:acyl dehydratase
MPLDYDYLMNLPPFETRQSLTARDTMLYALGVGAAADGPTDPDELQFVYEVGLRALPTQAAVMAYPGFWARDPKYKLTWQKLVQAEQALEIHRPLPVAGELLGVTTIEAIYDKGPDKGAILHTRRKVLDASDALIATVRQAAFLRADGGFGGSSQGAPKPHPIPSRAPDITMRLRTRPDQALLYRLSGDYNPLHADPMVAAVAGFEAPILHGMASYGIVGRGLLKALCGHCPERVRRLDVRFSNVVYPGETLVLEIWQEDRGRAAFRASADERSCTALTNGLFEYEAG